MAISTLTLTTPKPHNPLQSLGSKHSPISMPPPASCPPSHPRLSLSCSSLANNASVCVDSNSGTRTLLLNVGIGFFAASVLALSPLDAGATRIEYYATVGEPTCELSFARSGLGFCDVAVGSGEEVPRGELVNIHYTARFADGRVFDSSYKRARPLTMRVGVGKVIKGLDQGILGGAGVPPMQVGGKRKLQIPPQLAYGPEPAGCFSGFILEVKNEICPTTMRNVKETICFTLPNMEPMSPTCRFCPEEKYDRSRLMCFLAGLEPLTLHRRCCECCNCCPG